MRTVACIVFGLAIASTASAQPSGQASGSASAPAPVTASDVLANVQQYYSNAKQVWQELVQKAESTPEIANDQQAAAWVQRAKNAVQGTVDSAPSAMGDR